MVRLPVYLLGICLTLTAVSAGAQNMGAPVVATPSPEVAHLLALEIAARAKGGNAQGKFTPSIPVARTIIPPTAASPSPTASVAANTCTGSATPVAPDPADRGMHFMPLHRTTAREFLMPARGGDVTVTAQALRASVSSNKNESALAQAALQAANGPSASAATATELANIQKGSAVAPSMDPTGSANTAVLREIQRYHSAHGY